MVDPSKMLYVLAVLLPSMAALVQTFRLLDRAQELREAERDLASERTWRREAEQHTGKVRKDLAILEEAVRGLADRIAGDN